MILKELLVWIKSLESRKEIEIGLKAEDEVRRKIYAPEHLIFLGDTIELWDADDRSIYLCSKSIIENVSQLTSNVAYLVGNHDYLIGGLEGIYPLSSSKDGLRHSNTFLYEKNVSLNCVCSAHKVYRLGEQIHRKYCREVVYYLAAIDSM